VPNIFAKQQLEVKYSQLIRDILNRNGIEPKRIDFKIHSGVAHARKQTEETQTVFVPHTSTQATQSAPLSVSHAYRQGLNERYTFENFIVGSGSELAYAACQAVAQNPGVKYNPLFIYGGVGIGKTHLIQAVGNGMLQRNSNARVVYVTCEQFVQEFLDAIRYKKVGDFANHYRSADVLIVDDMQFIAGKEKTQEEFFHTFNTLHQANKQIILSSDRPPRSIPTLEDRLRTRFEMGMTVDMQAPDFETRCAIIQTKMATQELVLPSDLVEFLANYAQHNVRELEGALNQLLAFCEMRNLNPDLLVAQGLFGAQGRARPKHVSAKHIIEKTARYFQISLDDLLGPKRDKDIVLPRQIAMWLLRSELHLSFPKVARELGRKDHTTAIHSVGKITDDIALNPSLKQQIDELKERLYV
jgi:chromosomal replication initiator protein